MWSIGLILKVHRNLLLLVSHTEECSMISGNVCEIFDVGTSLMSVSVVSFMTTDDVASAGQYQTRSAWWRHPKYKKNPCYWPLVWGIHRWPVNSPHKGRWREALMFSLICPWIKGWINNREAGDLRRHRDPYNVIVMDVPALEGLRA